jgi:1-deoxy-D-xylulose-5-phosphate reductoisomerase
MALECLTEGGNMPSALVACGETAVNAFLNGAIKFTDIEKVIEYTLGRIEKRKEGNIDTIINTNKEAVKISAQYIINKF